MMMVAGLIVMLLVVLLVIGLPVLLAGGGLAAALRRRPSHPSAAPLPATPPAVARQCPACGREVRAEWQVCPFCGAALT